MPPGRPRGGARRRARGGGPLRRAGGRRLAGLAAGGALLLLAHLAMLDGLGRADLWRFADAPTPRLVVRYDTVLQPTAPTPTPTDGTPAAAPAAAARPATAGRAATRPPRAAPMPPAARAASAASEARAAVPTAAPTAAPASSADSAEGAAARGLAAADAGASASASAAAEGDTSAPVVAAADANAASAPVAGPPGGSVAGPVPAVASPVAAASSAPAPAPFAWPRSTRLSYALTGQYRGELHGAAQVEWVQAWPRYQVHLDLRVGLPFAPLFTRRLRSDGELVPEGLRPRRYDEATTMAFRDDRRLDLKLDPRGVRLADGRWWEAPPAGGAAPPGPSAQAPADAGTASAIPPGPPAAIDTAASPVQDSASQFVQLSYLFTRDPGRLAAGQRIAFLLALPRRVVRWEYEVGEPALQATPFGPVQAWPVRPRPGQARGGELLAEAWFAPSLAYLPVRIRIEQSAEVHVDLVIERLPELASR